MLNGNLDTDAGAGADADAGAEAVTTTDEIALLTGDAAATRSLTWRIEHRARFSVPFASRVALSVRILYLNSGALAGAGALFCSVMHCASRSCRFVRVSVWSWIRVCSVLSCDDAIVRIVSTICVTPELWTVK